MSADANETTLPVFEVDVTADVLHQSLQENMFQSGLGICRHLDAPSHE